MDRENSKDIYLKRGEYRMHLENIKAHTLHQIHFLHYWRPTDNDQLKYR